MTGEVKEINNTFYVVVNNEGTLEKLSKPKWYRVLLWHIVNFFKPFKTAQETKDFLKVERQK